MKQGDFTRVTSSVKGGEDYPVFVKPADGGPLLGLGRVRVDADKKRIIIHEARR